MTSQAKLFSGASAAYGGDPNAHVSLVDAAMPGMLPVINKFCVEQAIRTGLGLNAQINTKSRFDRKNYFYPDLPQGYQISQFKEPIVGEGEIEVEPDGEDPVTIRIERLHLEQDAGKSIHDLDPNATYVDLNRSGVALMEIVSKPDIRSPAEAAAYVKKLRSILIALGTCDGDIVCSGRLVLAGSAVVNGTIKAATFVVEEGATITGTVQTTPAGAATLFMIASYACRPAGPYTAPLKAAVCAHRAATTSASWTLSGW